MAHLPERLDSDQTPIVNRTSRPDVGVYPEDEPGRQTTGKLLTRDEARRIAAGIAPPARAATR
jgi:hypothetical protein